MFKSTLGSVLATLLALHTSAAVGHHSHASLDPNDVRVLSGVVTRYSWSMRTYI
jgi:hypothetical protein